MRCPQRLIAATVLIALTSALAGCGSMGNFDPSDLLDFLDTKKKLPGERKPVFPDGVPGLEQGVPKELYKGAREQQIEDPNAQAAAPDAAPEEEGSTAAAPPAPKPAKIVRKRTTAPPPDQSAAPAQSAFPAPMPSGTFTR